MKRMEITYHEGADVPKGGSRMVSTKECLGQSRVLAADQEWVRKASSNQIFMFFAVEYDSGRRKWAQLTVELDGVSLCFWLPEELDHVCDVFAMVPFPTARGLALLDSDEVHLNQHWLSRLPKKAKAPKFRERFLTYVRSEPKELREFRRFYGEVQKRP